MKVIKKIVVIVISLVLLLSTICFATTKQELTNKINETQKELDGVKDEKTQALQDIESLTTKIDDYQAQIDELDGQISNLNTKIKESEQKVNEAQENYEKQEKLLNERLVETYMAGETSYLDFLLSSESITDFISNYYLVSELAKADTELLEKIEKQKQEIEQAKQELESSQKELETSKASKQSVSVQLKDAKKEKDTQVANLSGEEKELQSKIDEYKKERDRIEQEMLRAAQKSGSSSGSGVVHNGQMVWPCPNYSYISSYFGGRSSPGGIGSTNHKAIDLAAPHGASILSAGAGTVILVSNNCSHDYAKNYRNNCGCGGGFGNYVEISHGNGLVTIYAHCSSIYVSTGQTVSAGQQIAAVGCTGHSTGNHLHFGMIKNGVYVDPLPYIQ